MSLLAAANTTPNIPLHCNVCPRKPDFSDISHLLTHVSSKGHLSNYFKLKVKAGQDAAAQKTVNDYDDWYEHYGVQGLMSDRMTQKERKKSGGGGGAGSGSRSRSAGDFSPMWILRAIDGEVDFEQQTRLLLAVHHPHDSVSALPVDERIVSSAKTSSTRSSIRISSRQSQCLAP